MADDGKTFSFIQLDAEAQQKHLSGAKHKQLQTWAKELGIPANGTSEKLKAEIGAKVRDKSGRKSMDPVGAIGAFFGGGAARPKIEDIENATVAHLKELCKAAGVSATGKKADLLARLMENHGYDAKDQAKATARHDKHVSHNLQANR